MQQRKGYYGKVILWLFEVNVFNLRTVEAGPFGMIRQTPQEPLLLSTRKPLHLARQPSKLKNGLIFSAKIAQLTTPPKLDQLCILPPHLFMSRRVQFLKTGGNLPFRFVHCSYVKKVFCGLIINSLILVP